MANVPPNEQNHPARIPECLNGKDDAGIGKKGRRVTFLDLPGEIRTQIYELSFPAIRAAVVRVPAKPEKGWVGRYDNRRPLTYKLKTPRGTDRELDRTATVPKAIPFGLVMASKQIYKETVFYLYSNTQFVFYSDKALRRFVLTTPCACQAYINSMEFNHVINGEPRLTFFCRFKLKGDLRWERTCRAIAWTFPRLKELYFNIDVHDWPVKMTLNENWARPILYFSEKKVDYAKVNLRMGFYDEGTLRAVEKKLERKLMTQKGNLARDEEEFVEIVKEATAAEAAVEEVAGAA